jgi:lantibiotic modifying enzyme
MSLKETSTSLIRNLIEVTQNVDYLNDSDFSFLSGLTGRLLFHWYAAKLPDSSLNEEIFRSQLQHLLKMSHSLVDRKNFGYGVVGFGWLMEILLTEAEDAYDPDFNNEVEILLTEELTCQTKWSGEIEYVLGLSGIAIFAARRLAHDRGIELYSSIVRTFANLAIYDSLDSCSWAVPDKSVYRIDKNQIEKPEYNLGLAHGVPAVICALLPAIKLRDAGPLAAKLVSDGCNWLMKQKLSESNQVKISLFPNCSRHQQFSRLGWCYGDLTIALTLARAGKALKRKELIDFAYDVGMHAARRQGDSAMVCDAGLCHGSAGLMLIFYLLHQVVPTPEFERASDYWFEYTLASYQDKGLEGLYSYKSGEYAEELGLLEGFSGIGLCLLARQGIKPNWVDSLLLA